MLRAFHLSPSCLPTWPVETVRWEFAQAWGAVGSLTEADARVLLADLVAVVVGEEHVGRETTLGGVGVCDESAHVHVCVDASNMDV